MRRQSLEHPLQLSALLGLHLNSVPDALRKDNPSIADAMSNYLIWRVGVRSLQLHLQPGLVAVLLPWNMVWCLSVLLDGLHGVVPFCAGWIASVLLLWAALGLLLSCVVSWEFLVAGVLTSCLVIITRVHIFAAVKYMDV